MLKIWGRISSINVQKVVWCATDLGLPFQRVDAGGQFGVVDTPEYARLNPNRRVPVIEDDAYGLLEERMPPMTKEITVPAEGEMKVDFVMGLSELPKL